MRQKILITAQTLMVILLASPLQASDTESTGFITAASSAETTAAVTSNALVGDVKRGAKVFLRCRVCHRLTDQPQPLLGPNLNDLFGRAAGTDDTFQHYSNALKTANFVWTEEKLDAWLRDPNGFLPGNKMSFTGIIKEQDRKDLIVFLKNATISDQ